MRNKKANNNMTLYKKYKKNLPTPNNTSNSNMNSILNNLMRKEVTNKKQKHVKVIWIITN